MSLRGLFSKTHLLSVQGVTQGCLGREMEGVDLSVRGPSRRCGERSGIIVVYVASGFGCLNIVTNMLCRVVRLCSRLWNQRLRNIVQICFKAGR